MEVFSDRDKWLVPLAVICLLIGTFLFTGHFGIIFPFVVILLSLPFSAIYAYAKTKNLPEGIIFSERIVELKHSLIILVFALFATLLLSIILPYVVLPNAILNIFVLQYVYITPLLFVFFFSIYLFGAIVRQTFFSAMPAMKKSVIITVALSLLISIIFVVVLNVIYNGRATVYEKGYISSVQELMTRTTFLSEQTLPVFVEIRQYRDDFLSLAQMKFAAFGHADARKGLCILTDCFSVAVDKAYHLVEIVVNSAIIAGMSGNGERIFIDIKQEKYKENFTTLEDYAGFLRQEIDASNFSVKTLDEQTKKELELIEAGFTYKDLKNIITPRIEELRPSSEKSIFDKSVVYVTMHSQPYAALAKLILKFRTFTQIQGRNPDLFVKIYQNKDIDEPVESKVIRYRLILDRMEAIKERGSA